MEPHQESTPFLLFSRKLFIKTIFLVIILLALVRINTGSAPSTNILHFRQTINFYEDLLISEDLVITNDTYLTNLNIVISGNIIVNSTGKLQLMNCNVTFLNNFHAEYGIFVNDSGSLILENCNICSTSSLAHFFIEVGSSDANLFCNNSSFKYAGFYDKEAKVLSPGLFLEGDNCRIFNSFFSDGEGIYINRSSNVVIEGCTFSLMYDYAIYLSGCKNTTVRNNYIDGKINSGNYYGIFVGNNASKCRIIENNIRNQYFGISSIVSKDIEFKGNILTDNYYGVYIGQTNGSLFSDNKISESSYYGFSFESSRDLFLQNNLIRGNGPASKIGILGLSGENITIVGNTVTENSKGIDIGKNCRNVTIYFNDFVNNLIVGVDYSNDTKWDNGTVGNYWGREYNGSDDNFDGIGEREFLIHPNGIDRFPLVVSFAVFPPEEVKTFSSDTKSTDFCWNLFGSFLMCLFIKRKIRNKRFK